MNGASYLQGPKMTDTQKNTFFSLSWQATLVGLVQELWYQDSNNLSEEGLSNYVKCKRLATVQITMGIKYI